MGCLKLSNNSEYFAIAGGNKYQPLAVAYKRSKLLNESLYNILDTERTTLHVMDDTKTVALLETDTLQNAVTVRYQYDNHLGSACLELDQDAKIISYEEYHPFGTTSYRSGRTETEVSLKRYKYVGKERDEETGLYYYGARYYAAWLCRFVSVDPLQFEYPHYTPYQYAGNKPISYIDLDGLEEAKREEVKKNVFPNNPSEGQYFINNGENNSFWGYKYSKDNGWVGIGGFVKLDSVTITAKKSDNIPSIISREKWGALPPIILGREWEKINGNLSVYYNTITIHHTGNKDNYLTIQELQVKEQNNRFADIPYHYAIDKHGIIYQGRPIDIKGAHVENNNTGNIGIVLLADLDTENEGLNVLEASIEFFAGSGEASSAMIESLFKLTQYLKSEYGIEYFGGHQEILSERHCPGNIGMEWVEEIRKTLNFSKPLIDN